jgi:hypothetical protein
LRDTEEFSLKEIKFSENVARINTYGIRKIFEATGSRSINLRLEQPDFDTPENIKAVATKSICSMSSISSKSKRSTIFIFRYTDSWMLGSGVNPYTVHRSAFRICVYK